jgi:hypothetical protein
MLPVFTKSAFIPAVASCHNPLSYVEVSWSSKAFLFNLPDGILSSGGSLNTFWSKCIVLLFQGTAVLLRSTE